MHSFPMPGRTGEGKPARLRRQNRHVDLRPRRDDEDHHDRSQGRQQEGGERDVLPGLVRQQQQLVVHQELRSRHHPERRLFAIWQDRSVRSAHCQVGPHRPCHLAAAGPRAEKQAVIIFGRDAWPRHRGADRRSQCQRNGRRVEAAYRDAMTIWERLADDFPGLPQCCHSQAQACNNLGVALDNLMRRAEAETTHRQALTIRNKLTADLPIVPGHRTWAAASLARRACLPRCTVRLGH